MSTATDLWEIHDPTLPLATAIYSRQNVRMAVIGIGNGELLIVSPGTSMSDASWARVAAWGTPRFLLAPNHFHNAGLARWQARFPNATLAPLQAALQATLPPRIRIFNPPGAKQGETMVSVQLPDGVAWFVTDALVNETRLPGGMTGLLVRLFGFRTGLMTNPFFKRLFLADKAAYKQWVHAELDRDRPTLFLPAHGAPLHGPDTAQRLRAATDAA